MPSGGRGAPAARAVFHFEAQLHVLPQLQVVRAACDLGQAAGATWQHLQKITRVGHRPGAQRQLRVDVVADEPGNIASLESQLCLRTKNRPLNDTSAGFKLAVGNKTELFSQESQGQC